MEVITIGTLYLTILICHLLIEAYIKVIVAAVSLIALGVIAYAIYRMISKRRKRMANGLRKLKRQKKKWPTTSGPRIVKMTKHRMSYECESCGRTYGMWLEVGLCEGGGNHKPVPFVIRCKCGGFAKHVDWSKDVELEEPTEIKEYMNYFANLPDEDCGIPILR